MARRRLGVALLLDGAVGAEVDGLRRALGDRSLQRIPPHITLVPPVNVREEDLPTALARLRQAASQAPPRVSLALGAPSDFLPDNAVLYLPLSGDVEALTALRDRVFVEPLARPLTWPFVAHVTLGDGLGPERIAAARLALDGYRADLAIERIHLLEERHDGARRWEPVADAVLGRAAVVGRGGLARELTRSQLVDPEALLMPGAGELATLLPVERSRRVVVTARQEGEVAGVAAAWLGPDGGTVAVIVHPGLRRQGLGGGLLAELEAAVEDRGWGCTVLDALGPAAFYRARSRLARPGDGR